MTDKPQVSSGSSAVLLSQRSFMSDNQQLYSSSQAMMKNHLLREQPVPQGLRSLWRLMTQHVDKQAKTFLKETLIFFPVTLKGLI